jgi:hypothetical protein
VPEIVSLKLSQFVPSSHESSPPPVGGVPGAVPFQVSVGPEGLIVPVAGSAAKARNPSSAERVRKAQARTARRRNIPDCSDDVFITARREAAGKKFGNGSKKNESS